MAADDGDCGSVDGRSHVEDFAWCTLAASATRYDDTLCDISAFIIICRLVAI